jgi:uncharacterized membrane protein YfcA
MKTLGTPLKKMNKSTLTALVVVFAACTTATGYFSVTEWIDYEAIFLCLVSGFYTVYCGWILVLKWDR